MDPGTPPLSPSLSFYLHTASSPFTSTHLFSNVPLLLYEL